MEYVKLCIYVFPLGCYGRILDLIVLVPDYCHFFTFYMICALLINSDRLAFSKNVFDINLILTSAGIALWYIMDLCIIE